MIMQEFIKNSINFSFMPYCFFFFRSLLLERLYNYGDGASGMESNFNSPQTCRLLEAPWWLSDKESACQCRRHKRCSFDPWSGRIPWRRKSQAINVCLPGKFHGQRSLACYSPWDCKELNSNNKFLEASWGSETLNNLFKTLWWRFKSRQFLVLLLNHCSNCLSEGSTADSCFM